MRHGAAAHLPLDWIVGMVACVNENRRRALPRNRRGILTHSPPLYVILTRQQRGGRMRYLV